MLEILGKKKETQAGQAVSSAAGQKNEETRLVSLDSLDSLMQ